MPRWPIVTDPDRVEGLLSQAQRLVVGEHCAALGIARWRWNRCPPLARWIVQLAWANRWAALVRAGATAERAAVDAAGELGLAPEAGESMVRAVRRMREAA